MSFRDTFLQLAKEKFTVPPEAIDALIEDDAAGTALDGVTRIDEMLAGLETLTSDENTFLADLLLLRQEFDSSEIFSEQAVSNVDSMLIALRFADCLSEEVWEEELSADRLGQNAFDISSFDEASKIGRNRVRVIGFNPATGSQNAMTFLDCRGITNVTDILEDLGFDEFDGSSLIYGAVATTILEMNEDLLGRCWCFCANSSPEARISTLKFHLVLAGCVLVKPKALSQISDLSQISETLELLEDYRQFAEPFEILGEYNSRESVLDGFLSLYHVLENFMLRARIASVSNAQAGSGFFSIRHFKQLSLAADGSEQSHLSALFRPCWDKVIGGSTLSDYGLARLASVTASPTFSEVDFHEFMKRLTVKKPVANNVDLGNWNEFKEFIPKIIYQLRCSIVHNKETEYHVSNRELDNDTRLLVTTEFVIPIMRRLAFGLPSLLVDNPIKYNSQSIELYR